MSQAIQTEWDSLTHGEIMKYIDNMPTRISACIAAGGGHTRY